MHHFIFPTQDTWISSGSSTIDGESFKDQNFGKDQILEVKKEFYNSSFNYPTRALVQFSGTEFTELSKSIADGTIPQPTTADGVSGTKVYLRLYEAEGNAEIGDSAYSIAVQPISQSWTEGNGKFGDRPKNTKGCSWENRRYPTGGTATAWSSSGVTTYDVSASAQSFSSESPDINVEVTDMFRMWLNGEEENSGMLIRFAGTQEIDDTHFGHLKFFSRKTHTIYSPKLEVKWDDHKPVTGSNTGSLIQLTVDGGTDNYLYMKNLQDSYKETDKVKFRVGARKQFIQKTFSTSVQTVSGSFIPEDSGSYSIVDMATGETVIPFSDYTKLSCDSTSNYFIQWLNGFYPNRTYKILFKLKYDDNQEKIFDNDFEFTVRR